MIVDATKIILLLVLFMVALATVAYGGVNARARILALIRTLYGSNVISLEFLGVIQDCCASYALRQHLTSVSVIVSIIRPECLYLYTLYK